ncbi:TldE/PmbA family protein, Actinobacterial subgroup [Enhygromyxa salina]|uniref:TldE/PmbA family protein, Actinobacterial subgroup n=1 Tax=Enhygromyxa salina TaxID=215803 RepID=A0A0C1Z3P0_9BACT|nr:metallopeptidase TldD-related protein [Enhygromyxa salina]KIG12204.1 TldE/PmbA family protein, Actinobacterial subgroup [Enhygromyxa salina]
MATLTQAQAKAITNTLLGAAMAPELVVSVRERSNGHVRFARNQPTTEGDVETLSISVTASIAGRSATVVGNRSDEASLLALVAEAEELAALSPIDPEHMPPVGRTPYLGVDGHDKPTAKLGAKDRAKHLQQALAAAEAANVELAGFLQHHEQSVAVATSAGAFGFQASTSASLTTTCRTLGVAGEQGSGWAGLESHRMASIDAGAITALAAEKADISQSPKSLDPGDYLVILEPQAVAELLEFLVDALDARAADEGRSWFSHPDGGTRVGEALFHNSINLRADPADKTNPASAFTNTGEAHKIVDFITDGAVKNLVCSRYWANKTGAPAIPRPSSVLLDGSDTDLLELVRAVDRAVLVTRFWYNRALDPRTILATGLTRDGTFLVEQGKITTAVNNFRYNDSPVKMLQNVVALGRPQRVVTRGGTVMVVPPIVVKDFHFASRSDAI